MIELRLKYYLMVVITTLLTLSISIDYIKKYFDVDLTNIEILDGELEEETEKEIDDKILEWSVLSCSLADEWMLKSNYSSTILDVSKYERTPPTPPPDFV